ncbi:MAG: DUF4838 domain-containing protein [Tepidisphaeraceae bacterium]|jgi:hypothetical protein
MTRHIIAAAAVLFFGVACRAQVPLVQEGKAAVVIVVAAKAAPAEIRAAEELRTTLGTITGATFSIVNDAGDKPAAAIVVGETRHTVIPPSNRTPLVGPDGFRIHTTNGSVCLIGGSPRGTMYAATALLEKLGVRYFTPKVTRIPKNPAAVIPAMDETRNPAFEYREPYFAEAFEKDWAAHLRTNGNSAHLDESTGGKIRYYPFVHSFDLLIPPAQFAAHPEYFPWIKGKRTGGYVQRCLSNPEVLKLSIEAVRGWMRSHPEAMIYSVSQNDCHGFCECDACKAIETKYGNAHSGIYLWFVNQIAEAVEKDFPDKLIDTLAYQFTEAAPTGIAPRKNVRVRLCPIAVCEAHPYEKCSAKPTVAFVKALTDWGSLTNTLYIWHYNTDFAHYLLPFPDFDQFPDSLRLYNRRGVRGVFFEGAYGAGGGGSDAELRSYVMAKLLWNPQQEARPLIEDWMAGVYGPAKAPMLAWFDLLHAKARTPDKHLFIYDPPTVHYLTADVLAQGDKLFDEAVGMAKDDAIVTEYVTKARLCLRYVKLTQNPKGNADLEPFIADLKRFGIRDVGEGRPADKWAEEMQKQNGK